MEPMPVANETSSANWRSPVASGVCNNSTATNYHEISVCTLKYKLIRKCGCPCMTRSSQRFVNNKGLEKRKFHNSIRSDVTRNVAFKGNHVTHPNFKAASVTLNMNFVQHMLTVLLWHVSTSAMAVTTFVAAIAISATLVHNAEASIAEVVLKGFTATTTISSSSNSSSSSSSSNGSNNRSAPVNVELHKIFNTSYSYHSPLIRNGNNKSNIFISFNTTEINFLYPLYVNGNRSNANRAIVSDMNFTDSNNSYSVADSVNSNEYIFDRTDVRVIFITLYTIVFCCCFFGNLLVILVVTLSRRLRSITNFFLANLALADFCVGLFCVMQNLSIYLIESWVFGEFMCRMYQFVHSLSYTASIFILVVICMERYFAIVHPITCKQILTAARLRIVILTVWITSAVYSTPKFVFSKTIKNVHTISGQEEEICVLDRKMFNSKLLDMINFVLLYVIPLLVMMILYTKIAVALWRSSQGLTHQLAQQENSMGLHNSMYQHHHHHHHHHHRQHQQNPHLCGQQSLSTSLNISGSDDGGNSGGGSNDISVDAITLSRKLSSSKYEKRAGNATLHIIESQVTLDSDRPVVSACRKTSFYNHNHLHHYHHSHQQSEYQNSTQAINTTSRHNVHSGQRVTHISHSSSNNVLRARRGVVRMLIIFVLTFALCNLPYHARKMWQYWSHSYRGDSNFNALFTPLTFLVTYFNSGINPLLYAFLSRNFRKGMRELLMCSWRGKSKTKSSINSSIHHKRAALQTHSLPTDTTHVGNEQL
ncbi:trissin receptor isoform 2-T4 [Glossina fuscipes fuscipes]